MRVPLSGINDEALDTTANEIISGEDFDDEGVIFWLRSLVVGNEHVTETGIVELYDQDEAAVSSTKQRGVFICPPNATTIFDIPAPGIAFKTNICAAITNGTVGAYGVVASGYKE